jgi:hypothetical protein
MAEQFFLPLPLFLLFLGICLCLISALYVPLVIFGYSNANPSIIECTFLGGAVMILICFRIIEKTPKDGE